MSPESATIEVTPLAPGAVLLSIRGEVTMACEDAFTRAHESAVSADATLLVLDFAGMDYMNSGGIGMLVTLLVRAQRHRQRLAAVGLTEHYRQIFELTRLDEAIALYDDADAAMRAE